MSYQMKDLLVQENHWQNVRGTTGNTSFCLPGAEERVVILPMILYIALVTALLTQHTFYKSFIGFFPWRVLHSSVASHFSQALSGCPPVLCDSALAWAPILFLAMIRKNVLTDSLTKIVSNSIAKHFAILITVHLKTPVFKLRRGYRAGIAQSV